ncbi:MAG: zf-HC2 domain-containing protein [Planctomycetes bacterium]|nr:zf-HC2 domain-containing protein [Planctomycetota bacterium]
MREPLHQPPNPDDLRRVPPTTPACAQVRGWLRDYVDADLEPAQRTLVEQHVHGCRTCAVELGRAEHEVLRLRRLFGACASTPALPAGFAARLVQRLVLDETSLVSKERLAEAAAAAQAKAARAVPGANRADRGRRVLLTPGRVLAAAFMLVVGLLLGTEFFSVVTDVPNGVARLVVLEAHDTFELGRRLVRGDGLGEQESLRLSPGGRARVQWHDPTTKAQPAATMWLQGKGEMRLEAGQPLLLEGNVEITTHREVVIPMADGSRLELGVGTYEVAATAQSEPSWSGLEDPFEAMPRDLHIAVEVKSGASAAIVRSAVGATLVSAGEIGVYSGDSAVQVTAVGGGPVVASERPSMRQPLPNVPPQALLFGQARDRSGAVVPSTEVLLAYASAGLSWPGHGLVGYDGSFVVQTQGAVGLPFAIAMASPAASRTDLGVLAPDVYRLQLNGLHAQFGRHLVFDASIPVRGVVRDLAGSPMAGVDVVPCLVDEWFGCVLPFGGQRTSTDGFGMFTVTRLPAHLPTHQGLVLLLLKDGSAVSALPVPSRGSAMAVRPPFDVTLRPSRQVRLEMLPAFAKVEVFEELPGIGADMGYRKQAVHTDGAGRVLEALVGTGRLWARVSGSQVVRELVLVDAPGPVTYRPAVGTGQSLDALFRDSLALTGTQVFVAGIWRHQRFATAVEAGVADLSVVQPTGLVTEDAQVFGVSAGGPRDGAIVRFLGLTDTNGVIALPYLQETENLVVVAPDGSTAFLSQDKFRAGITSAILAEPGRVLVGQSVRNAHPETHLTLGFVRLDEVLPGLRPQFVRFAGPASDYEVGDVPPGDYRVTIGSATYQVSVPSSGFVVLQ